jgi:pyridoxine/pyridoxamine 5'-phosphate oxidase
MTLPPALEGDLDRVLALLQETTTMVLATTMPDGAPRATPVFFAVHESLTLVFLSDDGSIHSRNLHRAPEVSVALYSQESDWRKLRGLQMMNAAPWRSRRRRQQAAPAIRFRQ